MGKTLEEKTRLLKEIKEEILGNSSLPLFAYRKENNYCPVIGEGNHGAKVMFVGEAPGKNEAETGRPFCGAAGKILDELLLGEGLKREDVYITNIVKDRPPQNRDPLPEEIDAYSPYLDRQIDIIEPKVIATLGRFSMSYLMQKFGLADVLGPISRLHGQTFETQTSYGKVIVLPLYHPAATIYDRSKLEDLKKDFKLVKKYAG